MKFSIIVPVYNAGAFVSNTIFNLLEQDVEKEIILINDGSTDDSLSILKKFEKENECIKVIDKINGGVSSARNVGLDIASGDYICFVDSDDALEPGTLSKCNKLLSHTSCDAIFFSYKYIFSNNGKRELAYSYKPTGLYSARDWLADFINLESTHIIHCIGTTIYSKQIIEQGKIRFNQSISYLEDVCFCVQYLSNVKTLYYINEPLYHYQVVNSNSLIMKPRLHISNSLDYLRELETKMFQAVYGNEIPYKEMYGIFGDNIIGAIGDLFNCLRIEKESVIKEISNFSNYSNLSQCITYATSKEKRYLLTILSERTNSEKFKYFRTYFRRIQKKNKIINFMRSIKYTVLEKMNFIVKKNY